MLYYALKVAVSSFLIVLVSEVSKRNTFLGSVFASVPMVSILAFIWLYTDTGDKTKVAELSLGIFWLVIPSLSMFITLPLLLKKTGFYPALAVSAILMILFYFLMMFILHKLGIRI
ncbi:MAG: DUF3147 family protein [Ignavibacteria bacterium]|jgi:Mg/Co/Ni transporter MgtE|nr:DUF3147 family protein [Ignavibacteria bacterium]MCU7504648.1 DUF3147 family protein [Ignavibacteria bacterium]MCU7517544.1 DUF3147 family protein [Ignavibacteria bacterium]